MLNASGIAPLMKLLKQKKEDTKVTLHSTAAIQNLTYKNTECCAEVLDHQGEKALKNLLTHKKEDVQQFAAGALANLQLYKRKEEPAEAKPKGQKLSMKVANILSRKGKDSPRPPASGSGGSSIDQQMVVEAAMKLQAVWRGNRARRQYEERYRKKKSKKANKYDVFRAGDVRNELAVMEPTNSGGGRLPTLGGGGKPPGMGFGAGLAPMGGPRLPPRLAPIGGGGQLPKLPGPPAGGLPPMGGGGRGPPPMPPGLGGYGGGGSMSQFGAGFNPPMGGQMPMPGGMGSGGLGRLPGGLR